MAAAPMRGRPFVALFESRVGSVGLSDVGAAIGVVSLRSCGLVAWRSPNRP